jgi:spore germination cell wall hydrolase CwlJ-like protein
LAFLLLVFSSAKITHDDNSRLAANAMAAKATSTVKKVAVKGDKFVKLASLDPVVTGTVRGDPPDGINRRIKGDLLVAFVQLPKRAQKADSLNAGVIKTVALLSPAVAGDKNSYAAFVAPALIKPRIMPVKPVQAALIVPPVPKPLPKPIIVKASAPAALAYASPDAKDGAGAAIEAVIRPKLDPGSIVLVPKVDANHAWVNNPIPTSARSKSETKCLATAIYFEARGEPERGQLAVAQVVLNRLKNPAYPKTVCGVVYQNKNMRNRCQFSFACDGIKDRISDAASWKEAQTLASEVVNDDRTMFQSDVGTSTHYHANYVRPRWARHMKKMQKIGRHIFYKTYGGGWS